MLSRVSSLLLAALLAAALPSGLAVAQDSSEQAAAEDSNPLAELDWQVGPVTVNVGSNATFDVPEGYAFLDAPNTARFMELTENPSSTDEYTFAPQSLDWFAVLQFEDTGHVKDDEEIDAESLIASLREGTEAGNEERRARGWSEMHITGWRFKPRYDVETKRLEWAIDAESDGVPVTNFNTRILGRTGVTSVTLVEDPDRLEATVPEFKAALAGYSFTDGNRYADFKPGDKVAQYGLAALVAGGAAAAAVKTGAFKGLWKILVAGAVALLAGLKSLFGRKKPAEPPAA